MGYNLNSRKELGATKHKHSTVASSFCSVCFNTTSDFKTCLHKIRQLDNWQQVPTKGARSRLDFSLILMNSFFYKIWIQDMKCRNISNLISSPQIKVRNIPRFSKKEPEQLSFYFLKDLGKVKQDWRLKPSLPTTKFLCRIYD